MKRRAIPFLLILFSCISLVLVCCGTRRILVPSDFVMPAISISEVCISNKTASYDDDGDYGADYIELYNSSDEVIDLSGWGITDDKDNLNRYILPKLNVSPGQAIILWCDSKIVDTSEYEVDYIIQDVHAIPFRLSGGETVVLSDPGGGVQVAVSIPKAISAGKVYSFTLSEPWHYMVSNPSPYYVEQFNVEEDIVSCTLKEPEFSIEGGWYDEPVMVEIEAKKGVVYYTTNGVDPTPDSEIYDGPILISDRTDEPNLYSAINGISLDYEYLPTDIVDKCTVLKAIVIDGDRVSPIKTETFFVGLKGEEYNKLPTISLSMSPMDLFGLDDGIYALGKVNSIHQDKTGHRHGYGYANYFKRGIGWEREAKLEFYSEEHKKLFEQNIGVRIHGGGSREANQKSFSLYARNIYDGNNAFIYDPFTHSNGGGICNKLVLRTGGEVEMYYTKLRDVLFQTLASGRAIGTQRAIPCNVFLNGEYWGLYNLQEKVSECYVQEHYGVMPKDQILIKKNILIDNNEAGAFDEVTDFVKMKDLSLKENYDEIEDMVDIQSLIDYYATEFYSGNPDSFANNVGMWKSTLPDGNGYNDGRWRWLLFDLDEGVGLKTEESGVDVDSFIEGNYWGESCPIKDDALFAALIQNSEFKERFITSFMDLVNENFSYDNASVILHDMAEACKEADIKSQQRFRGELTDEAYYPDLEFIPPYSEEDYERDISVVDSFLRERGGYMTKYLKRDFELKGSLCDVIIVRPDEDASIGVNTLTLENINGRAWKGRYYSDYPIELSCNPGANVLFKGWRINGKEYADNDIRIPLNNSIIIIEPMLQDK